MKRLFIAAILIFQMINLSGCENGLLPPQREISDLQLIQVMGMDKGDSDTDDIILTAACKKIADGSKEESGGSGEKKESNNIEKGVVLHSSGKTMFEAARNMQMDSDKIVFWGHAEYYIIGEEAARENIGKYIDFLSRDHELRIDARVYVVKDSTARELIEEYNRSGQLLMDKLKTLGWNMKSLSISEEMKISDLMQFIDIHHSSARVPCIKLVSHEEEGKKSGTNIECVGYGIYSNFKLVNFIGNEISRGVNIITNKFGSSIIAVKDLLGSDASIELTGADTEIIPIFGDDKLEDIILKAKIKGNLGEITSRMDVTEQVLIEHMEDQVSKILKAEIESVLKIVGESKSDCLNICDRIRLKRPIKWHKIKDNWMEVMLKVDYKVQVDTKIQRTYDIQKSVGNRKKRQT